MLVNDLDALAQERLDDANALLAAGRPTGAYYICGYAIELKLKARMCRVLHWPAYPPPSAPGDVARALKTHKLPVLLMLSGLETTIPVSHPAEWGVVARWDSEQRYKSAAAVTAQDAQTMITATATLLPVL